MHSPLHGRKTLKRQIITIRWRRPFRRFIENITHTTHVIYVCARARARISRRELVFYVITTTQSYSVRRRFPVCRWSLYFTGSSSPLTERLGEIFLFRSQHEIRFELKPITTGAARSRFFVWGGFFKNKMTLNRPCGSLFIFFSQIIFSFGASALATTVRKTNANNWKPNA